MEKEVRLSQEIELTKVILNEKDEAIYINDRNPKLFDRFAEFAVWIQNKEAELEKEDTDFKRKHKKGVAYTDESGETVLDAEALLELCKTRTATYREATGRIDAIFGEGTMRKFCWKSFEYDADFVPDDESIFDFLEQITPVLNDIFADRRKRIELKYSKNRRGGRRKKYRSKEQLIADYKE